MDSHGTVESAEDDREDAKGRDAPEHDRAGVILDRPDAEDGRRPGLRRSRDRPARGPIPRGRPARMSRAKAGIRATAPPSSTAKRSREMAPRDPAAADVFETGHHRCPGCRFRRLLRPDGDDPQRRDQRPEKQDAGRAVGDEGRQAVEEPARDRPDDRRNLPGGGVPGDRSRQLLHGHDVRQEGCTAGPAKARATPNPIRTAKIGQTSRGPLNATTRRAATLASSNARHQHRMVRRSKRSAAEPVTRTSRSEGRNCRGQQGRGRRDRG